MSENHFIDEEVELFRLLLSSPEIRRGMNERHTWGFIEAARDFLPNSAHQLLLAIATNAPGWDFLQEQQAHYGKGWEGLAADIASICSAIEQWPRLRLHVAAEISPRDKPLQIWSLYDIAQLAKSYRDISEQEALTAVKNASLSPSMGAVSKSIAELSLQEVQPGMLEGVVALFWEELEKVICEPIAKPILDDGEQHGVLKRWHVRLISPHIGLHFPKDTKEDITVEIEAVGPASIRKDPAAAPVVLRLRLLSKSEMLPPIQVRLSCGDVDTDREYLTVGAVHRVAIHASMLNPIRLTVSC